LALLLSVMVGITTTVILFCSHWHQIQGDIAAGKMSPLVRLGTSNACKVGTTHEFQAPPTAAVCL
jgi:1,4-dihydroxy-2-naphthoate octaprenyltransferase